jgi:hypothetical protein
LQLNRIAHAGLMVFFEKMQGISSYQVNTPRQANDPREILSCYTKAARTRISHPEALPQKNNPNSQPCRHCKNKSFLLH